MQITHSSCDIDMEITIRIQSNEALHLGLSVVLLIETVHYLSW